MTALSTLPPGIRSYLDDFVARTRRAAVSRAVAVAVAVFVTWTLLWCLIDRFTHLPPDLRVAALAVGIVLALVQTVPKLLALRRRPDLVSAAAEVERANPRFQQRLLTVTSRVLGAATYRGSDEILLRLVHEVDEQVTAERATTRIAPLRAAAGPWVACALLLLLFAGLLRAPGLRFKELAGRVLNPLGGIPPVTTTLLTVTPGDLDVVQSQPVTIDVRTERLGDSPVTLFLSEDDRSWNRAVMSSTGGGHYTFGLAAVDRDVRYHVTGGDAQTPDYLLRVLRRPAVAQFEIRYEYPSYTRLPAGTMRNTDGHIEAPSGTRVVLTITATEPLEAALLTIGGERMLMERATDPYSRRAEFVVRSDASYTLDLISTREVAGSGPAGASIRAVPDLPPQVRLARGGDSLRLNPRDIVPVWYEALDDYGLKSLHLRAQLNDQSPVDIPVRIWGDPRRQQDVFNFDLATLPLGIGDVVKLVMTGTDTAGHSTTSAPLTVLISPRSVDFDAYQEIGELQAAAQLAQSLSGQFEEGVKAIGEATAQQDRQSAAYAAANSRADRALSVASQTATLLRQSLLRATTHSHAPQLCVALAGWIDLAESASAAADDAFRRSGAAGGLPDVQRDRLARALETVRQLQAQLTAVEQGEQAAAVLADHENLQATQKRPLPKDENGRRRVRETIERMRQDIAAEAGQLGLDPGSNDLDNQLRARARAEQDLVNAARPVDFAASAAEWAAQLQRDPRQRLGFESRLSAGAQAEAIRADADLIHARDLELASRAAAALAASCRGGGAVKPGVLGPFVQDVRALQREAELRNRPPAETRAEREAAATARRELARMAGDPATALFAAATRGSSGSADDRQKDAENLALQASAAAAGHEYKEAAAFDQALAHRLQAPPRRDATQPSSEPQTNPVEDRSEHHQQAAQSEMATARKLDDLGHEQDALAGQSSATRPAETLGKQQDVAEQIAAVEKQREGLSPAEPEAANGRDRAASEVLAAQEQLSAMPQALAAAQAAAAARREAAMRAGMARAAAGTAPPEQREAALRASQAADQSAADADAALTEAASPVSPAAAQGMGDRLAPFAPETDAARASILGALLPALQSFQQAARGDDAGRVDQAANESRKAIEACQRELSAAQETLVQRDPLAAARWFAKAAAESLSLLPPDVGHARTHQARASAALSRAWDQSIHRAATERLSAVPSMAAILDVTSAGGKVPIAQQASKFAAAREWGRLRPQEGPDLNASMHEADPPGYEESLKLYFEALGKVQEGK